MKFITWTTTIFAVLAMAACASNKGGVESETGYNKGGIKIAVEQPPTSVFTNSEIKSVAVLRFDAKGVKAFRGEVLDYIELSNVFTDDLIKSFYKKSPGIEIAIGEFEDTIIESDLLSRQRGDQELRISKTGREIILKATPYKKIDAVINGRINVFKKNVPFEKSYIHLTLKVVNTYDGKVYWITDMDGNYRDVIETISLSVNRCKLTYPIPAAGQSLEEKKGSDSKPEEENKDKKKEREEKKPKDEKSEGEKKEEPAKTDEPK